MRSLFLCLVFISFFPAISTAQNSEDSEQVCQAASVTGEVTVETGGEIHKLKVGDYLRQGARVSAGKDSFAILSFDEEGMNIMQVSENSSVTVKSLQEKQFVLRNGELLAKLKKMKPGQTFEISTPVVVASVRGTEYGVAHTGGDSDVSVFENKVEVFNLDWNGRRLGASQFVEVGSKLKILKGGQFGKLEVLQDTDWKRRESFNQRTQKIEYQSIRKAHPFQAKNDLAGNPYERRSTVEEDMANRGIGPEDLLLAEERRRQAASQGATDFSKNIPVTDVSHKEPSPSETPQRSEDHHREAAHVSRDTTETASPTGRNRKVQATARKNGALQKSIANDRY